MKPYRTIPITECGEPLVPIPPATVLLTTPHPYVALGAPYGGADPWRLRAGVVAALVVAQTSLAATHPGWRLKLFDAWRPNAVQHFMVQREFRQLSGGLAPEDVAELERTALWEQAYRIWAIPSDDPATPPPHSTGAALDLTVTDAAGREIHMGSPIDENSERSSPDYFKGRDPVAHANRLLLLRVMRTAGFTRHPEEWWHFSLGDQMWAWLMQQQQPENNAIARYGGCHAV